MYQLTCCKISLNTKSPILTKSQARDNKALWQEVWNLYPRDRSIFQSVCVAVFLEVPFKNQSRHGAVSPGRWLTANCKKGLRHLSRRWNTLQIRFRPSGSFAQFDMLSMLVCMLRHLISRRCSRLSSCMDFVKGASKHARPSWLCCLFSRAGGQTCGSGRASIWHGPSWPFCLKLISWWRAQALFE